MNSLFRTGYRENTNWNNKGLGVVVGPAHCPALPWLRGRAASMLLGLCDADILLPAPLLASFELRLVLSDGMQNAEGSGAPRAAGLTSHQRAPAAPRTVLTCSWGCSGCFLASTHLDSLPVSKPSLEQEFPREYTTLGNNNQAWGFRALLRSGHIHVIAPAPG